MSSPARFEIGFAPEAVDHLAAIERRYHRLIASAMDEQLVYTPEKKTRNRKPVEQPAPFAATWELRLGPGNRFRVFYEVDHASRIVWVLAIGIKERERLWIGGEEMEI